MTMPHLRALERVDSRQKEETGPAGGLHLASPVELCRYEAGSFRFRKDSVAVETNLRVQVEGQMDGQVGGQIGGQVDGMTDLLMSRTPGDDMHLVIGHLFSLSMIKGADDIRSIAFSYQGTHQARVTLGTSHRVRRLFPQPRPTRLAPEQLFDMKRAFEDRQRLFKNTGSTHAAALFGHGGDIVSYGEDVGRHNAFDKAIGAALTDGTLDEVVIAMLSSRLALELATKAATANIPVLCGFSAATSSGIRYAERNNLTLVGRLAKDSFNVYANGWRIRL